MADYNFEEVINCVGLLVDDCKKAQNLDEQDSTNCDNVIHSLVTRKNSVEECNKILGELIWKEKEWYSTYITNLEVDQQNLKILKEKLQNLKATEAEKQEEYEKLRKNLNDLQGKTKTLMDAVSQDVKNQKDVILTYKLLTSTTFLYNIDKVAGFVSKDSTAVPFCYNPTKLSEEEITEKLWKLVLE